MSVRKRNYQVAETVHHGRNLHLRARSKIALLKGQPFRAANKGVLTPDERRAVEEQMRRENKLMQGA